MRYLAIFSLFFFGCSVAGAQESSGTADVAVAQRLQKQTSVDANSLTRKEAELKQLRGEIAALRTRLGQVAPEIMVTVKFIELERSLLKGAGVDIGERSVLEQVKVQGEAVNANRFCFRKLDPQHAFLKQIEAWIVDPQKPAKLLMHKSIATVLGQPALLRTGGEIPVLIPGGKGSTNVDYRKIGTQLEFFPEILEDGKYLVQVRPRVCEIDPSLSVMLNGQHVPGFTVDECDLAIEMSPDQVIAVGGMVQHRERPASKTRGNSRLGTTTLGEVESLVLISLKVAPYDSAANVPKN